MVSIFPNSRPFGLHISHQSLTVAYLGEFGQPKIKGVNVIPLDRNPWLKTGLRDKEILTRAITQAVREASPHPIKEKRVACSLPESAVFTKVIKLPKLSQKELRDTIPYEAADTLPLPLEEVYLDWQVDEVATDDIKKPMYHVLVVAAPKRLVDDLVEVVTAAGLELVTIESQPFAVTRSLNHLLNKKAMSVISIIDQDVTTTAIGNRDKIKFTSTLLAGNRKLRQNPKETIHRLAEEINESVKYYHNRIGEREEIEHILLAGEGAMVPDLAKHLEKHTKIPCFIGHPNLTLPDSGSIHPRFTTVIGLALWKKER